MNWVDLVIIVLVLLSALHGWRTGGALQVFTFGGLWLGLVLGVLIAPPAARLVSPAARGVVAIVVVLVAALLLGFIGEVVGLRVGRVLRRIRLRALDKALGAVVGAVATLLACWLLGNLVAGSRLGAVDRAVQDSAILQGTNRALPTLPSLFARVESFLAGQGFPVVFVNLPPQLLPPASQPSDALVRAALAADGRSTVKVIGPACNAIVEGSGFVVAPELVVTNAHVVAGDTHPQVVDSAGSYRATPILFDPKLDVAVLRVPGLSVPTLHVDTTTVAAGTKGAALGYPGNGGLTGVAAAVNGSYSASGLDIYGNAVVTRKIYELHAVIVPGNSGGQLVSTGSSKIPLGTVFGLVFARSTSDPEVGYALAMHAVSKEVAAAEASGTRVGTGACAG